MCTQQMYLIIHVTSRGGQDLCRSSSPAPPEWENEKGEKLTLQRVWADSKGEQLDDQEAQRRQQLKLQHEQSMSSTPETSQSKSSCCSSKKPKVEAEPSQLDKLTSSFTSAPSTMNQITALQSSIPSSSSLAPTQRRCNCGSTCQCTLCPQHPNNAATRKYNAQQLNVMTHAPGFEYMPSHSAFTGQMYQPASSQHSCMGGQATYFLSTKPHSQQDLQHLMPGTNQGDYLMSYPVDASDFPIPHQQMEVSMQGSNESDTMALDGFEGGNFDFTNQNYNVDLNDPSFWEMGDADVDQVMYDNALSSHQTPMFSANPTNMNSQASLQPSWVGEHPSHSAHVVNTQPIQHHQPFDSMMQPITNTLAQPGFSRQQSQGPSSNYDNLGASTPYQTDQLTNFPTFNFSQYSPQQSPLSTR